MPSKLINHTLSSITQGITQQYQEGRFETQVNNMVNCMPSLSRGVLRRNPIDTMYQLYSDALGTTPINIDSSFVYSYDRGTGTEQYVVVLPGDGKIYVYNVNNSDGIPLYIGNNSYLIVIGVPRQSFEMITVGDYSFILNKEKQTAMKTTLSGGSTQYSSWAFYWIKKTTGVVVEQKQVVAGDTTTAGSKLEGYSYTLNSQTTLGQKATAPFTTVDILSADKIATDLATKLSYTATGSFIYKTSSITAWDWEDTFGNEASLGVWKNVDSANKLPAKLPSVLDGFVVKVSGGTSAEFDDYYLKYDDTNETWIETIAPSTEYIIDEATMPHVLYRMADGGFYFDTFKEVLDGDTSVTGPTGPLLWRERTVGDDVTNENPSFIGKAISNVFFHRNRLGFITGDSIILSGTGDYGNFFSATIQDVLDDDPIDLAVATTDVTVLRQAVSAGGSLLLFADDTQFELTSSLEGPLTPESANIQAASNYTFNSNVTAKAVGNKIYFTSISGGYAQLFAYKLTDRGTQATEAIPLTLHVPSFIDKTLFNFIGHDVLGYNFLQDTTDESRLIVLTNTSLGNEDLQNAFHTWNFAENISTVFIINNNLHILFKSGKLGEIKLEIPGDITSIVYDDVDVVGTNNYESSIEFSQFFWRDAEGKGTPRGRLQLRTLQYALNDTSKYQTEIINTSLTSFYDASTFGSLWDDTLTWEDTLVWSEASPAYARIYKNDDKVTVTSDARYASISFKNNEDTPTLGFELATVNVEMLYHQRSVRV